jgi:hypothetical protein
VFAATATDFERDGFAIIPGIVGADEIETIGRAIDGLGDAQNMLRRNGSLYGVRDALRALPEVRNLARSESLLELVRPVLGDGARAVRALLFDKTPEANWGVPWHQDLTIAVKSRVETPGFGPWTVKAGIHHVRPPVEVLERMVTLRIHLDDCRSRVRTAPGDCGQPPRGASQFARCPSSAQRARLRGMLGRAGRGGDDSTADSSCLVGGRVASSSASGPPGICGRPLAGRPGLV